jgi:hypothetical protein
MKNCLLTSFQVIRRKKDLKQIHVSNLATKSRFERNNLPNKSENNRQRIKKL